jgi:hypothetical protein
LKEKKFRGERGWLQPKEEKENRYSPVVPDYRLKDT